MPREYSRSLRVGAELQRVLNELLRAEVKDPRLAEVHVSEVTLTNDLGVARVYYSTLNPDDDPAPVEAAFGKAAGFLRARVGREVRLRRVPELRFERDASVKRGFELGRLIAETRAPAPERFAGPDDSPADRDADFDELSETGLRQGRHRSEP
jgi:ribosome-binding factor A